MTIISTRRLSLLAAGSSLAILAAAAPAAAQEESFWSGWYLGANAGGAWGDNNLSRQIESGRGVVVIPPADIAKINGLSTGGSNKTGFTGGLEGGYNFVNHNWLFGIEVEGVALSTNSRQTNAFTSSITQPIFPPPPPVSYSISSRADTDWMVDIRPRIGFTSGQWLFYGTGGVAFADVKSRLEFSDSRSAADAFATEKSSTKTGWIAGLGGAYAFSQNWSVKAEWLYADFGSTRTTATGPNGFASLTSEAKVRTNIARIGFDYRFAPAAAPTAAPTAPA